jgi:uncharacterized protein YdeI (YjbR/CyaY-like superfamily)
MNPGLLQDTEGVLEPQGPGSRTPSMIRFTHVGQVGEMEPVIRAYLRQLMDQAEAGTKPPRVEPEIDMPDELTEALDADPELAAAFLALTPGRRRSYMFDLNQAKQSATRVARIEKSRGKILAGKGAMERRTRNPWGTGAPGPGLTTRGWSPPAKAALVLMTPATLKRR